MGVLEGKVAIITGASSGIGRATVLLFAREGARLVVSARDRSELDVLVAEVEHAGGEAVAVAGDVKDESLAQELVEVSVEHFGWARCRLQQRRHQRHAGPGHRSLASGLA
jgi:NAD(P)-dependent dehydrogenase (short-subunit alcohol dehydrogenase family)